MKKKRSKQQNKSSATWVLGILFISCLLLSFGVWKALENHDWSSSSKYITAADYQVHGIDVSHHQGHINWKKVASDSLHHQPIRFAFAKCTEGRSKFDDRYSENKKGIRHNGLIFGAYHYYKPGVDIKKQAKHFIQHAQLQKGDLPPMLDVEEFGSLSQQRICDDIVEWSETVGEHYDCIPILYSSHSYLSKKLNDQRFTHYPIWKAHYLKDNIILGKRWVFCQYTKHGHVNGIKYNKDSFVDLDVFCGNMEELQSICLK